MNKNRRQLSCRGGMTLVEVMVATVLVALLGLLFVTVFGASANQMTQGRRISSSAAAGVARVEQSMAGTLQEGVTVTEDVTISFKLDLNGTVRAGSSAADYYETQEEGLTVYGFKVKEAAP